MPTTRSTKRPSEAFQTLESPKRGRKATSPLRAPRTHAPGPSPVRRAQVTSQGTRTEPEPEPAKPRPTYVSTGTQTDEVVVLTKSELVTMIEEKTAAQKRSREDDTENEPRSKRMMLTPQPNPDRTLWMFPPTNSTRVPRTAPAKSFAQSPRRIRASISRTPRLQRALQTAAATPLSVAPVEANAIQTQSTAENVDEDNDSSSGPQSSVEPPQTPTAQPARRGIFGSIRGFASTGLQYAINLTPRRANTQPPLANTTLPTLTTASIIHESDQEEDDHTIVSGSVQDSQNNTGEHVTVTPESEEPTTVPENTLTLAPPLYDHFHYLKSGDDAANQDYLSGKIPTPSAPRILSKYEMLKENHPDMDEAMLRRIAASKERHALDMEKATGVLAHPPPPICAPLFGPDSHYARGTIDPRFVSKKNWMSDTERASVPTQPQKRKFAATVEDENPRDAIGFQREGNAADDVFGDSNHTAADSDAISTPVAKKQKTVSAVPPVTPRSAMKKPGDFGTSYGRSSRNVLFNDNPVSDSRGLRAHYGPAGQYRGSTFADKSPPSRNTDSTQSSLDYSDVFSPSTQINTRANATSRYDTMIQLERNLGAEIPEIDFTLRDPNNPDWRPCISNPRPGSFRVPFIDEEDEIMDEQDDSHETTTVADQPPAQPSTPRMSHAELPNTASPLSSTNSFNSDSISFESTELALEKARSAAQKYKPKDSSRLSNVSQAISRSPSPERATGHGPFDPSTPTQISTAPAVRPLGAPPQPFVEPELDNTIRGEDGMTDYEREHQYDDWAANLDWPEPQTYEEAGLGTADIHRLIRKNWGPEDDRRSSEFWQREFDEADRDMKKAQAQGKKLQLLTGMEEMDEEDMEEGSMIE